MDDREYAGPDEQTRQSLFWPIVLVGVGLIWLLHNLGWIQGSALGLFLRFWPALLIVIGLDLLVGRLRPVAGTILGVITVAGFVLIATLAPSMGWDTLAGADMRTDRFTEPLAQVDSAKISLDLSRWPTTIHALGASSDLIDAKIDYSGTVSFETLDQARRKTVSLSHSDNTSSLWTSLIPGEYDWDIGLSPRVPLDLFVDVGSGTLTANLEDLALEALELQGGSGTTQVSLPNPGHGYRLRVDVGSGSTNIDIAAGCQVSGIVDGSSGALSIDIGGDSDISLEIEGGSGPNAITLGASTRADLSLKTSSGASDISVPQNRPLRIEIVDSGSGRITLPDWVDRLSGDEDEREGVWQSKDYTGAVDAVTITLDTGSGGVRIH